jgi:hypothetical protein
MLAQIFTDEPFGSCVVIAAVGASAAHPPCG